MFRLLVTKKLACPQPMSRRNFAPSVSSLNHGVGRSLVSCSACPGVRAAHVHSSSTRCVITASNVRRALRAIDAVPNPETDINDVDTVTSAADQPSRDRHLPVIDGDEGGAEDVYGFYNEKYFSLKNEELFSAVVPEELEAEQSEGLETASSSAEEANLDDAPVVQHGQDVVDILEHAVGEGGADTSPGLIGAANTGAADKNVQPIQSRAHRQAMITSADLSGKFRQFVVRPEWDFTFHGGETALRSVLEHGFFMAAASDRVDSAMNLLRLCKQKYENPDSIVPAEHMLLRQSHVKPFSIRISSFNMVIEANALSDKTYNEALGNIAEVVASMKAMDTPGNLATVYDLLFLMGSVLQGTSRIRADHRTPEQVRFVLERMVRDLVDGGLYFPPNPKTGTKPSIYHMLERIINFKRSTGGLIISNAQNDCVVLEQMKRIFPKVKVISVQNVPWSYQDCPMVEELDWLEVSCTTFPRFSTDFKIDLKKCAAEQRKREIGDVVEVESIIPLSDHKHAKLLRHIAEAWKKQLEMTFEAFVTDMESSSVGSLYTALFRCLPPEDYLASLQQELQCWIHSVYSNASEFNNDLATLTRALMDRIIATANRRIKARTGVHEMVEKAYNEYLKYFENEELVKMYSQRQYFMQCIREANNGEDFSIPTLKQIRSNIGFRKFVTEPLFEVLLRACRVPLNPDRASTLLENGKVDEFNALNSTPAFIKRCGGLGTENFHVTIGLSAKYKEVAAMFELKQGFFRHPVFSHEKLPLLCPPLPRFSTLFGGFLEGDGSFLVGPRRERATAMNALTSKVQRSQLNPVFDCVNQLASTPWKINKPILDLQLELFSSGRGLLSAGIVPNAKRWARGMDEMGLKELKNKDIDTMKEKELEEEVKKSKTYRRVSTRKLKDAYSQQYLILCVANDFRDKVFWQTYRCDFRGRTYTPGFYLTHLSVDYCRSLLLFAMGRPLGPKKRNILAHLELSGLDWLKIHAINFTGLAKRHTLLQRLDLANTKDIMQKILASARAPLEEKWWTQFEKPWQLLATCMEINNAVQCDNPEDYVCYLPIHQDGSCNGLQHYAALVRDEFGAQQVNVLPNEIPGDVYTEIAVKAEAIRKRDEENGILAAKHVSGMINRAAVKETIMTTVYGVTHFGAGRQFIEKIIDIKRRRLGTPDQLPVDFDVVGCGMYLADITMRAMDVGFARAQNVQVWLQEIAHLQVSECMEAMQWTSPAGFLVYLPYTKTCENALDPAALPHNMTQKWDHRKAFTATASNLVHSLDACHMMLTTLFSRVNGFTLATVHDCFWTHPCDVGLMNEVTREQFYRMHSVPILENLVKNVRSFVNTDSPENLPPNLRYLLTKLDQIPERGNLDLKKVKDSIYFFS